MVSPQPLLPSSQDLLHRNRCALFNLSSGAPSKYNVESLAFTHVPKAGGSSFQYMLKGEARRHNMTWTNVHEKIGSRGRGEADVQAADVLIGHGSYQYMVDYLHWWPGPRATFVTLLRQPSARLESLFRFHSGEGEAYARRILAQGGSLQAEFEKFLRHRQMGTEALQMHRKKATCADVADANDHFLFCLGALTAEQVEETFDFIRDRYAVVGVLERPEDTMEVLRCRVPWVERTKLPHSDFNAQTWRYPVQLHTDTAAMRNATYLEDQLYARANEILTEDLECCRHRSSTK